MQDFYLKNRSILIADSSAVPDSTLKAYPKLFSKSLSICTEFISGVNPVRLALYPALIEKLSKDYTPRDVQSIEDGFLTPIDFKSPKVDEYVRKLYQSGNQQQVSLANRISVMLKDIDECCICLDGTANTVFVCGHATCKSCAKDLALCPICRANLEALSINDESIKLKKFKLIENTDEFYASRFTSLVKQTQGLNDVARVEINLFCKEMPDFVADSVKDTSFPSEETLGYVMGRLFHWAILHPAAERKQTTKSVNDESLKWNVKEREIASYVSTRINTPNRLIRFLSSLTNGLAVPDAEIEIKHMQRPLKKWIANTLNEMATETAEIQIKQRKALKLAAQARNKAPFEFVNPMTEFNALYAARDVSIFQFLEKTPGIAFRYMRSIVLAFLPVVPLSEFQTLLPPILNKMPVSQVIELAHIFIKVDSLAGKRIVYRVKNCKFHESKTEPTRITSSQSLEIVKIFQLEISSRTPLDKPLWIDTSIPWHNMLLHRGRPSKIPAWTSTFASTGDISEKISATTRVVLFIHWVQELARVDLDLSVAVYDKSGKTIGYVSFHNLKMAGIEHSGDITNAPKPDGAAEWVSFTPATVMDGVGSLDMLVLSYTSVEFEAMDTCVVGLGIIQDGVKGDGPGGCTVLAASSVSGRSNSSLIASFDFTSLSFQILGVNYSTKEGDVTAQRVAKYTKRAKQNFQVWMETRRPPCYQHVLNCAVAMSREVVLWNGTERTASFTRREGEDGFDFSKRVFEKVSKEKKEAAKSEEEQDKEDRAVLYFGSLLQELPKGSVVVGKTDPKVGEGCVWTSDPYSAFA